MAATPMWQHRIDRDEHASVVTLSGELDMAVSGELRDLLLDELTQPTTRQLTADLTAVTFLDSTALSSLLTTHTAAHDRGQTFQLINPNRTVRRVLEITGLYDVLIAG